MERIQVGAVFVKLKHLRKYIEVNLDVELF